MEAKIIKKRLNFKFKAGTSRGIYTTRDLYYIVLYENGVFGVGECAPLPILSIDDLKNYQEILKKVVTEFCQSNELNYDDLRNYPSILFGLESALLHLNHQDLILYPSNFTLKHEPITINGLVWMGNYELMRDRLNEKINLGFKCIKIKIGAIDFNDELKLLQKIRQDFSSKELEIRVDANGAFSKDVVYNVLDKLAKFELHSIEQPIKAGQIKLLAQIVKNSPLAIALDEELITNTSLEQKYELLNHVHPHYIVLKPSLHGGIKFCDEWISLAHNFKIDYWITSALESNIGLNVIAQYAASKNPTMPQGLGTGQLFINNIDYPLHLDGQHLYFDKSKVNNINFKGFLFND